MDLEDRTTLASAEGIDLDLSLAGIGSRGAALAIDLIIEVVGLVVIGFFAGAFGDAGAAVYALAGFAMLVAYPIVAEAFAGGQTVGKALLGIAVVGEDGAPVTFFAAAIRGVVRLIDLLPGVYLVGLVSVLATERGQRLGDLAARTLVIHRASASSQRREAPRGSTPLLLIDPVLSPEAAGWDVSAVDAEDLAMTRAFLVRRTQLDPGRRADLAQTLAFRLMPKVAGVPLEGGPEHFLERVVSAKSSR